MSDERKRIGSSRQAGMPSWARTLAMAFVAVAVGIILFMTGSATFDAMNAGSGSKPVVSAVQGSNASSSASTPVVGLAASAPSSAAGTAANSGEGAEVNAGAEGGEDIGEEDVPMAASLDPAAGGNARSMGLNMRWAVALATVAIVAVCVLLMRRVNRSISQMKGRFR